MAEQDRRINEATLILPALAVIGRRGSAITSDLIRELTDFFQPEGEDAAVLAGRRDTKFSQKVRNLVSHRDTNGMAVYTDLPNGIYTLTPEGKAYLADNREVLAYMAENYFGYGALQDMVKAVHSVRGQGKRVVVYDESDMVKEGQAEGRQTEVRRRSQRLREAAVRRYTRPDGRIVCVVCGFDFGVYYGMLGRGYIQIHHEEPIYHYSNEGLEQYISEAVEKMKPVCANCHCMLHRNRKKPLSIAALRALI